MHLLATSPAARTSVGCACNRSMANASATDGFTAAPVASKAKPKKARNSARDVVEGTANPTLPWFRFRLSAVSSSLSQPPLPRFPLFKPPRPPLWCFTSCFSSPSSFSPESRDSCRLCFPLPLPVVPVTPPLQKVVIWVAHVLGFLPTLARRLATSFRGISPSRSSSSSAIGRKRGAE